MPIRGNTRFDQGQPATAYCKPFHAVVGVTNKRIAMG